MSDKSFLNWPFFEQRHRDLAAALEAWCVDHLPVDHSDVDAACRGLVAALGADVVEGSTVSHINLHHLAQPRRGGAIFKERQIGALVDADHMVQDRIGMGRAAQIGD